MSDEDRRGNAPRRQLFDEISSLISRLHDDMAAPDDAPRLAELISRDEEARDYYFFCTLLAASLSWENARPRADLGARASACRPKRLAGKGLSVRGFVNRLRRAGREASTTTALMWLVMAILCSGIATTVVFCVLLVFRGIGTNAPVNRPQVAESTERGARGTEQEAEQEAEVQKHNSADRGAELPAPSSPLLASATVARLVHTCDCRWAIGSRSPRIGDDLEPGRKLELMSGLAEIMFQSGVRAVLQGPATMEIGSKTSAFLRQGKVTVAVVDPDTRGFEIDAPGMRYTDLGTEFGVLVAKDGTQEMHVFRGTVRAEEVKSEISNSKSEISNPSSFVPHPATLVLTAHQAIRVAAPAEEGKSDKRIEHFAADEMQFVRAGQMARIVNAPSADYLRWKRKSEKLGKDPDLIAYYDFQPDPSEPKVLRNRAASGSKLDGRIEGAQWAEGRWPAKGALRFRDRDARVRVDIPGRFEVLTAAAWINVEDLRNPLNSIIDSDSWHVQKGQCHWQLYRNGTIEMSPCNSTVKNPETDYHTPISRVPVVYRQDCGAWCHLAAVYDSRNKTVTYYRNGRPLSTLHPDYLTPLVFGSSQIGNWEPEPPNMKVIRYLPGRIDELMLLSRALSDQEIEELYEDGKKR